MDWLVLGILAAIALGFVLVPLIRSGRVNQPARKSYDLEVYRDQLVELEADLERGDISATQAAAARTEIERRILKADDTPDTDTGDKDTNGEDASTAKASHRSPIIIAVVLGLALPALAFGLYTRLGSPGLPDRPMTHPFRDEVEKLVEDDRSNPRMEALIAKLLAYLRTNPKDEEGWGHFRRAISSMTSNPRTAQFLADAIKIRPGNIDLRLMYGESLVILSDGQVSPAAKLAFQEVLAMDAGDAGARYYLALAKYQNGDIEDALKDWTALVKSAPKGAPWLPQVIGRMREAAARIGNASTGDTPGDVSPSGPALSAEQRQAIANMSPEDRQKMVHSMVERLADRLEADPSDYVGWIRLARAYTVLGEKDKSISALHKARAAAPAELAARISQEIKTLESERNK